jgi:predicted nucleotidyltransferase component of viral defense system
LADAPELFFMTQDIAASVRARLLNLAKAEGSDFNQVLVRYTLERLLYRLSQSGHVDRFVLKGALLFTLWYDMAHRPTRDADLLGFGPSDLASIGQMFRDIAAVAVEDGIIFDPASVSVEEIRKEAGYAGARVLITGELAKARCRAQVDIGFGDAVTPGPVQAVFPVLLADFPAPQLSTYPVYTVIAEKLHAIALLGMTNTRLKDYLDLSVLLAREVLDAGTLAAAIAATFVRRGMSVPTQLPIGLSDEFANDATRQALWHAFLKKNALAITPLPETVSALRVILYPAFVQAALRARSLNPDHP